TVSGTNSFAHFGGTFTSGGFDTASATPEATFFGQIDEVGVWDRALTAAEVQGVYGLGGASKATAAVQANFLTGNAIGTDTGGSTPLGNGGAGVLLASDASNDLIGETEAGAG